MAFADDFVQCMSQYGVSIDSSQLPDQETLRQAIDYALQWYQSLDSVTQAGLDAATYDAGDPGAIVLADPSVNVAPALTGLLYAFDSVQGSISQWLTAAQQCCATAAQAAQA
jgi:hypothetical protein